MGKHVKSWAGKGNTKFTAEFVGKLNLLFLAPVNHITKTCSIGHQ